jgi:catechol 2,3-dioxygenase-like lactoylglutathione lyase family enzyme
MNHVSLVVHDHERSAAFYGEHFGLTERVFADGRLLILAAPDGAMLALSEGEPPELPRENHFGFRVEGREAVDEARRRFAAAGVPETEWQDDGTWVRVQVTDPDDYRVEVFAYCRGA